MNILNINATLDPVFGGGTAERTRRLSSALARAGHRVTVLCTDLGLDSAASRVVEGADVVALPCLNRRFNIPVASLGCLRKLIDQHDVIHLCGHWTALNAVVYWLAKKAGKPYVVTPAGALPLFGRSRILKSIYNALVGHALVRDANALVAVTPAELPQFAGYGVDAARVSVIPNGVDEDAFEVVDTGLFRARHALGTSRVILFVGRLNPIKGPDLLLEAFVQVAQCFPDTVLVFAGSDGGLEKGLRQKAIDNGIADRVRFVGYVAGMEKVAAYRAATLVVIPSRQEAMSIVVLESGAAGVPVLITDQCGFDVVEEIGGGRVVRADVSSVAAGLTSMLDDPDGLPLAGMKLSELVRRDYSWDSAASALARVLSGVCGSQAMRILVVTQYFWPENFRINDFALGLRERGHEVLVLTGKPNYPGGRLFDGYSVFGGVHEQFAGVEVVRVPLFPRGQGGALRLAANYLSFAIFGCLLAPFRCKGKFDAILVFQLSPVTVGLPAIMLKGLKRAPILFWVQDLWPQSLSATGIVHSRLILGAVDRLVRWMYRRCDLLLVQSRAFFSPLEKQGVPLSRIRYFPNTAEAYYRPVVASSALARAKGFPGGFCILFAGNIGAAQDFPAILDAAEQLRAYTDIQWIIVGDGRLRVWVQAEITRRGLESCVRLLGSRPPEEMPALFALADALLVTLRNDPIFEYTVPSKVQSYLACGRPIIAALGGEGARVLAESGAAFISEPGSSESLASAVLEVYRVPPQQRNEMGSRGADYFARHFEREWLLREFDGFLNELTGKQSCES